MINYMSGVKLEKRKIGKIGGLPTLTWVGSSYYVIA